MTKMKAFRLPDPAWELLGELSKRQPAMPPARKGRASVVMALLKDADPATERETALYDGLFPDRES